MLLSAACQCLFKDMCALKEAVTRKRASVSICTFVLVKRQYLYFFVLVKRQFLPTHTHTHIRLHLPIYTSHHLPTLACSMRHHLHIYTAVRVCAAMRARKLHVFVCVCVRALAYIYACSSAAIRMPKALNSSRAALEQQ